MNDYGVPRRSSELRIIAPPAGDLRLDNVITVQLNLLAWRVELGAVLGIDLGSLLQELSLSGNGTTCIEGLVKPIPFDSNFTQMQVGIEFVRYSAKILKRVHLTRGHYAREAFQYRLFNRMVNDDLTFKLGVGCKERRSVIS